MCKNLSYKILFLLSFILTNTLSKAQYISVDTNYNAQQLVDKFLGKNAACINVIPSSIKINGWDTSSDKSYGYFTKGTSNFDINEGIILSTGKAKDAEGPKGRIQSFEGQNWKGDDDLNNEIRYTTVNATFLEFEFTSSTSTEISFEYMMLSEEFYVDKNNAPNCSYSDGLAFLIKKADNSTAYKNFALVPGTNVPVTVPNTSNCPHGYPQFFGGYIGQDNPTNSPTNFNGQTKVMIAKAPIEINTPYKIKIVIADEKESNPKYNGIYDSAIFLKAGSFVGNISLGQDLTMENNTALCTAGTYTIDATPTQGTALRYTWKKDGIIITTSQDQPTHTVNYTDPGLYEVEVELASGCLLRGHITVEQQILPSYGALAFNNLCDDDLDGKVDVFFSAYVQNIITNISASNQSFDIKYFKDKPADPNNPDFSKAITNISFTSNSQSVWMWVKPGVCDPVLKEITFSKKAKSTPEIYSDIPICDEKLVGSKEIDLMDYKDFIASNIDGTPRFYKSRPDANNQANALANTKVSLSPTSQNKFYIRYNQHGLCDDVEEMTFIFKQPAKSTTLENIPPICKNTTTTLDAGAGPGTGFTSYKWSIIDPATLTDATTREIKNVPVGVYTVTLGYNGCFYTQTVEVKEAPTAIIDAIDINGSTVTVTAIGGTAPYRYAIDDNSFLPGTFQNSPTFTNVPLGNHTIYVKSDDTCGFVSRDFSVINIANVISPNADGKNDIINLSELLNKTEARFKIYNRNGVLVFDGNNGNKFIWDGKQNGRVLPTGTYWYIAEWIEPTSGKKQQVKSWILLKNY